MVPKLDGIVCPLVNEPLFLVLVLENDDIDELDISVAGTQYNKYN